jgi:prolyl 4-hydroxylase
MNNIILWSIILLLVITVATLLIYTFVIKSANELPKMTTYTTTPKGYTSEEDDYIEPVVLKDIITEDEAKYIIQYAKDRFAASQLVGDFEDKSIRDSETCWIKKHDKVVNKVIQRICTLVDKPYENAEDLQVVRYKTNGMYKPHHDACCDSNEQCEEFLKRGGQRVRTIVIYLTDDFEGGETNFPTLNKSYKPSKYSGILFYPLDSKDNTCHPHALHEGSPVTRGVKMICNVWIRESVFV